MDKDQKVYSLDRTNYMYHEDFILELEDTYEPGEKVSISVAEPVQATNFDFICIDQILERMAENALDDFGDISGSYLEDIDDETKGELFAMIGQAFDKCIGAPNFFRVKNVIHKQMEVE